MCYKDGMWYVAVCFSLMYDMGVLVWQATANAERCPWELQKPPSQTPTPIGLFSGRNSAGFALKLNDLIAFKLNKMRVRKVLHFTHSLAHTERPQIKSLNSSMPANGENPQLHFRSVTGTEKESNTNKSYIL